MSCSIHPWWPHAQEDCPFCAETTSHNMAIDLDGNSLPFTPHQVDAITHRMADEGTLLASIWRVGNDLAVRVEGPPSQELLDAMERAVAGYRRALKGQ